MENHITHKPSRLFPSSSFSLCRFRTTSDVIENSIILTKSHQTNHQFTPLSSSKNLKNTSPTKPKRTKKDSLIKQCPISKSNSKPQEQRGEISKIKSSFSSNGGWFSSEEQGEISGETDTFFSLSSNSTSGSFRRNTSSSRWKTAESCRRVGKSKSSEAGHCALEVSLCSTDGLGSFCWKTTEMGRETTDSHWRRGKSMSSEMGHWDTSGSLGSVSRKTIENPRETIKECQKTPTGHYPFVIGRKIQGDTEALISLTDSWSDLESVDLKTTNASRKTAKTSAPKTRQNRRKSEVGLCQFLTESEDEDSSDIVCFRRKTTNVHRKARKPRRRRIVDQSWEMPKSSLIMDGRLEESYAMEKISCDPYSDFRTSMLEMIVEKQIFGDEDLERLLDCFISLNSSCHHKVIVHVFLEICEALFTLN